MTTQPVHDRLDRTPTWTVQAVFDPDVTGQDFSYTIGLHDRAHPELHLWASPTHGADPGDDWSFSMRDRCHILNELAFAMLDGKLGIGSRIVKRYDHGLVSATFEIGPPGDREALEAFGIAPGALVLPVAWSLERKPPGVLAPMTPEAERDASAEYAAIVGRRTRRPLGPVWTLPARPSFAPDQVFGPRTPVVLARAAELDGAELVTLLQTLLPYAAEHRLAWPITVARTLAREVGRVEVVDRLERASRALIEGVLERLGGDWGVAVAAVDCAYTTLSLPEQSQRRDALAHLLADALTAALVVEAVGDVADDSLLLLGRGPWLAGLHPERTLPGPDWTASPGVLRSLRKVLRPLTVGDWKRIVAAHCRALQGGDSDCGYPDLSRRLMLLVHTTAAGCPWKKLTDLPAAREARGFLGRGRAWEPMVEWASLLAALITHRAAFDADEVSTFVGPVRQVLPDLGPVVNAVR